GDTKSARECRGPSFATPVCNLVEEEGLDLAAKDKNHVGQSCGEFGLIQYQMLLLMPDPRDPDGPQYGSREAAYQRGAWAQSLRCHKEQVLKEIRERPRLAVSTACLALAEGTAALIGDMEHSARLAEKDLVGDESFCSQKEN